MVPIFNILQFLGLMVLLVGTQVNLGAQTLSNHWVVGIGGDDAENLIKTSIDENQNVISFGQFQKTADLDPTAGQSLKTAIGFNDCYLQKLNANGQFKWAVSWGGKLEEFVYSLALDKQGNIYAVGSFNDSVDFDPGPGKVKLFGKNASTFILKLDSNGIFQWVKQIDGPINTLTKALITNDNQLILAGTYSESVDFDPNAGIVKLTVSTLYVFDARNAFICKYNSSNGSLIWAKEFRTDKGFVELNDACVDKEGNILSCGYYNYIVDLDPGSGTQKHNVTSEGFQEGFLSKLTQDGNFVWAKSFAASSMQSYAVGVDQAGNVAMGGTFYANVDFDPGSGSHMESSANSSQFIVKLNKSGNFQWVKVLPVNLYTTAFIRTLQFDAFNNIIIAGEFNDTVDFDPGTNTRKVGSGVFIKSGFVAKYNEYGDYIFAYKTGNGNKYTINSGVALSKKGNIYAYGVFMDTLDFKLNSSSDLHIAAGGMDEFVQKFNCSISYSVTQNGGYLNVAVTGASIQWIDCATNSPINGEIYNTFIPQVNGQYAVALNKGECTIISSCLTMSKAQLHKTNLPQLEIFPNPSSNKLHFQTNLSGNLAISISDVLGNVLLQSNIENSQNVLDVSNLLPGIYFVTISNDQKSQITMKFIRQ